MQGGIPKPTEPIMHFNRDDLKGLPFTFPTTISRYIDISQENVVHSIYKRICVNVFELSNGIFFCFNREIIRLCLFTIPRERDYSLSLLLHLRDIFELLAFFYITNCLDTDTLMNL